MPTPSEHKTLQARILAYAEAEGRDIWNWRLDIGDSRRAIGDLRLEIRERREDLDSRSLSSLRSLRLAISEFFDHEEKRERDLILKRKRRLRGFPDREDSSHDPNPYPISNSHEL